MTIGERFGRAIAERDSRALLDLLDPAVDFRGLTPSRFWETSSAAELVDDVIFGSWFDASDHVDALEDVQLDSVADRDRVTYRLRITNGDGTFLVEQVAYFGVEDDRINWLRILCSGFRPVAPSPLRAR